MSRKGKLNPNYGHLKENPAYTTIHDWIRRELPPPDACPVCGLHAALHAHNISGTYKRELSDWKWLCCRCHMVEDGRMTTIPLIKKVGNRNHNKNTGRFC